MEMGHGWYGGESPHLGLLSQENNIKIEKKVKVNWIGQVGENGQYSAVDSKVQAGQERRIQHPRGWVFGTVFAIDWLTTGHLPLHPADGSMYSQAYIRLKGKLQLDSRVYLPVIREAEKVFSGKQGGSQDAEYSQWWCPQTSLSMKFRQWNWKLIYRQIKIIFKASWDWNGSALGCALI